MHTYSKTLCCALLVFACVLSGTLEAYSDPPARPRVVLALSGGGAYGLLYLGALEWLEQHRIPVDGIAGNSGGALVGGWYATGIDLLTDTEVDGSPARRTPADMRLGGVAPVLSRIDMESLFQATPPYGNLPILRKRERRRYPSDIFGEFGHGVYRSQDGIIPGQNIGFLFDWVTQAYPPGYLYAVPGADPFDRLPTPFRCIAVNAESRDPAQWKKVVLGEGNSLPDARNPLSLSQSIRASMSIPIAFTPVRVPRKDGSAYRLVDGAGLDNFPTDVAIDAFAPDVLLAFRYRGMYEGKEKATTLERRLVIASDLYKPGTGGKEPKEKLIFTIDPKGARADQFDRWRELAWMGYQQMEEFHRGRLGGQLDRLSLSPEAYGRYRAQRRARRRDGPIIPTQVTGDPVVQNHLERIRAVAVGQDLTDPKKVPGLVDELSRLVVDEGLTTAGYTVERTPTAVTLNVQTTKRLYGPPFFRSTLHLDATRGDRVWTQASARISDLRTSQVGDWVDASLGSEPVGRAGLEIPLTQDLFLSPTVRLGREQEFQFDGDHRNSGVEIDTAEAGTALSYRPPTAAEIALGAAVGANHVDSHQGNPLDVPTGSYARFFLRGEYDTTDSATVPRHGTHLWGELRDYPRLAGADGLRQAEAGAETFFSGPGPRTTVAVRGEGGTSFGNPAPFPFQYRLGGFGSFAGYRRDEIRTSRYLSGRATFLREFAAIPFFLGHLYSVTSFQSVAAEGRVRNAFTLGAMADTRIGNVYLGMSVADRGIVRPMFELSQRF